MKTLPIQAGEKILGRSLKARTEYTPSDMPTVIDVAKRTVDLSNHPKFGLSSLMIESEDLFLPDGVTPKPVSQQKVVILEF